MRVISSVSTYRKNTSNSGLLDSLQLTYFGTVLQDVGSEYTSDGSVDINKQPALKGSTGRWRACYTILGNTIKIQTAIYANYSCRRVRKFMGVDGLAYSRNHEVFLRFGMLNACGISGRVRRLV